MEGDGGSGDSGCDGAAEGGCALAEALGGCALRLVDPALLGVLGGCALRLVDPVLLGEPLGGGDTEGLGDRAEGLGVTAGGPLDESVASDEPLSGSEGEPLGVVAGDPLEAGVVVGEP